MATSVIGRRIRAWNQGGGGAPAYWAGTLAYGTDATARNSAYTSMWQHLEPNRGRYWFEAAGMVTGRGGVKDMDAALPKLIGDVRGFSSRESVLHLPTHDDIRFIIAGNAFLYPYNLHSYFVLRDKREVPGYERLRGDDLDRGLVVLEQTLVQQFIDSYGWPSPESMRTSLIRLSDGFHWASDFVKDVIVSMGKFDFGSLDSRIRLGIALVAKLRWFG